MESVLLVEPLVVLKEECILQFSYKKFHITCKKLIINSFDLPWNFEIYIFKWANRGWFSDSIAYKLGGEHLKQLVNYDYTFSGLIFRSISHGIT